METDNKNDAVVIESQQSLIDSLKKEIEDRDQRIESYSNLLDRSVKLNSELLNEISPYSNTMILLMILEWVFGLTSGSTIMMILLGIK